MGLFDNSEPYKGQKYKDIKNDCIKKGVLFSDPTFPPSARSLSFKSSMSDVKWKRPGEISSNPKFFEAGVSSDDFSQGTLGNCWFVAACACLAEDSKLWKRIVPDHEEQEWTEKNTYAGIFHFKFWRCGGWIDVVIDDYLPTRNGRLIYVHSNTRNEFWSALLEKAYAKLAGDYESLTAGNSKDALVDMTGGVGERIDLSDYETEEKKKDLFRILKHSKENHSLISASIAATANDMEAELSCGLVKGHAYSITAVKKIKLGTGLFSIFARDHLQMVRCRNPWGGTEWKGAWSDGSPEWNKVSDSQKKDLGLTFDDNGEFWMSYDDFCHYYTSLDICHMVNTSFFSFKKTWREGMAIGEWKRPDRCGGCGNHSSFLKNHQYIFDITDDSDEIMLSLEQKDKRVDKGTENFTIGFSILKTDLNRKYRMHDTLERVASGPFVLSRSVFNRVRLQKGRYCVIPSTFDPGSEGKYVLRLYATNDLNLIELVHEEPMPGSCCGFSRKTSKVAATQITLVKADGLQSQDLASGLNWPTVYVEKQQVAWEDCYFEYWFEETRKHMSADAYCIIKYEGRKLQNHYKPDTVNPEWNDRFTLYRKKPTEDITIEVWNHNILRDSLMGIATLPMSNPRQYTGGNIIKRYNLFIKEKQGMVKKPGGLWLKVLHTDDMDTV